MTGVASQLCGDIKEVKSLGYRTKPNGIIYDGQGSAISMVGERHSILSDLSPIATFISRNYVDLSEIENFEKEAIQLIDEVEMSLSWLYQTKAGLVLSALWSDVFLCPNCSNEFVFLDAALRNGKMQKSFPCPVCDSIVGKSASKATGAVKLERAF